MANIINYVENQLRTFSELPFNCVDSLILSSISYFHLHRKKEWKGIRLRELYLAENFPSMFKDVWNSDCAKELLCVAAASPRFRDIKLVGFCDIIDTEEEKQFSALTFLLDDGSSYIAFRGTDATLVGWKEDFNMAFRYPIPSQEEALKYLKEAASHCKGPIRIGGHSKGGNLAVYAAANIQKEINDRIIEVYSHDGPGFMESVLGSPQFKKLEGRINKTLPQSSIIGMLLEHQENYRIVKSNRISFMQHDPFSWLVDENDFVYLDHLTQDARFLDLTLNNWVQQLSHEERERFVDTLYSLIGDVGTLSFYSFRDDWQNRLPAILQAASKMDEETKAFLLRTVKELISMSLKNFPELFKPNT